MIQPKKTNIQIRAIVPIKSLRDLEYRLGEDRETLRALAKNWQSEYSPFQQAKPPKPFQKSIGERKMRHIDNPSEELKRIQTKILKRLLLPVELPHFLFGAVSNRCVRKHAAEHLGSRLVVKMDVKSYYPNVTTHHVYAVWTKVLGYAPAIASLLTALTTYEWHLPQGAPTSPALANLFLASIYEPVLAFCSATEIKATAWVDDLIFSGAEARSVMELVRQTLADNGFKLSPKKRFILKGCKPKIITGVRLGAGRIRVPKEKLHDIRAAIHKLEIGAVTSDKRERYVLSLNGRLGHVQRICASDAAPLIARLQSILAA
jgi:hypothetical protein